MWNTFKIWIKEVRIDNHVNFQSDNKSLDMIKIYDEIKPIENSSVTYEPVLDNV